MRYLNLKDLFEVKCKECGSLDVILTSSECSECGSNVGAYCNNCHTNYNYHDFKQIDEVTGKITNTK